MHRVLVLVCVPLAAAAAAPMYLPEVQWQAHSYNDIREWHQLFLKDLVSLKLDPQYVPPALCAKQARAPANDTRGCLLLNHDTIDAASRTTFNTTADVLTALTSPALRPYLTRPGWSQRVFVALCFKAAPGDGGCDNSTAARNWLSLVDDFVAAANAAVAGHALNLEFVLDGDGVPNKPCKVNRWGWNATYIPSDDGLAAFTSNDHAKGYDAYAVLNPPAGLEWDAVSVAGYGKFTASRYPYQVWEPSSATDLLANVVVYRNATASGRAPRHLPAGVRFAINIDPVQFQVYTGVATGNALSTETTPPLLSDAGAPLAAAVAVHDGTPLLVTVATRGAGVVGSVTPLQDFNATQPAALTPLPHVTAPAVGVAGLHHAVVVATRTQLSVWNVTAHGVALASQSAVPAAVGSVAAVAAVAGGAASSHLLLLASTNATHLLLQLVDTRVTPASPTLALPLPGAVARVSVAATASVAHPATAVGVVAVSLANATVVPVPVCLSAAVACRDCVVPDTLTCGAPGSAPRRAPIVGSNASVAMWLPANGTARDTRAAVGLLTTWTDGFCPNSEHHNKNASGAVCDRPPVSTPAVMQYQVTTLQAWLAATGASPPSPCDATQVTGSFGRGTHPSGVLYRGATGRLAAAVVHGGGQWPVAYQADDCGLPLNTTGVVTDAWAVPRRFAAAVGLQ